MEKNSILLESLGFSTNVNKNDTTHKPKILKKSILSRKTQTTELRQSERISNVGSIRHNMSKSFQVLSEQRSNSAYVNDVSADFILHAFYHIRKKHVHIHLAVIYRQRRSLNTYLIGTYLLMNMPNILN
jgi:hypothetical protein